MSDLEIDLSAVSETMFPTVDDLIAGLKASYSVLDAEVSKSTMALQEGMSDSKGTKRAYERAVNAYEKWWTADQERRVAEAEAAGASPKLVPLPAHPITGTKVAIFLNYEVNRPLLSRAGKEVPNSRLSFSAVQQIVSGLENTRKMLQRDQRYIDNPESCRKLRQNYDIQTIETAVKRGESMRQKDMQQTKADGVKSQTFTRDEHTRIGASLLKDHKVTALKAHATFRDRAMMLLTTAMAFRGDNVRAILWSDVMVQKVTLGRTNKFDVTAFTITSNQGKTNLYGRIDAHGALRHDNTVICPIGAVGLYLFSYFHIIKGERPPFAPNYEHPSKGTNIGYREWYDWYLFPSTPKNPTQSLSSQSHLDRVNKIKADNDIVCKKVTHGGRVRAAEDGIANGASMEGMLKAGGWSVRDGAFSKAYNTALPTDAMVALAGFNGESSDSYHCPREHLAPPSSVCDAIFPWVEEEEQNLQRRIEKEGLSTAKDQALTYLLETLKYFRRVIPQDIAVLRNQDPDLPLLHHYPFNTPEFLSFANEAPDILKRAEEDARSQLKLLPDRFAASFQGTLETAFIRQEEGHAKLQKEILDLKTELRGGKGSVGSRKAPNQLKRKVDTSLDTTGLGLPHQRVKKSPLSEFQASPKPSSITAMDLESPPTPLTSTPSHSSSDVVISGAGNLYSTQSFPLDLDIAVQARQIKTISSLEVNIAPEKLRHATFEWVPGPNGDEETSEWLPHFDAFWKPRLGTAPSAAEIWKEYKHGIGLRLSVCELIEGWGARWKRGNNTIKVESTRRMKIVRIFQHIHQRRSEWSEDRMLAFFDSIFPLDPLSSDRHLRSTRTLADYLQKKGMMDKAFNDIDIKLTDVEPERSV